MELIDTHAHLNFASFTPDFTTVLENTKQAGIGRIINVGTDIVESKKVIELAQKYDYMYATVGIHPTDSPDINIESEIENLEKLISSEKVVAIGECGLDFYRQENPSEQKRQIKLFEDQIQLALKNNLPLIVHSRKAWPATLAAIKKAEIKNGVFHSWTYPPEITKQALAETNFYLAFNGIVTFKNALEVAASAKIVPLDRLLLETDCPFLTPEPNRGLRNTPEGVKIVAKKLAEINNTDLENIARATTNNAISLFKL